MTRLLDAVSACWPLLAYVGGIVVGFALGWQAERLYRLCIEPML